MKINRLGCLLLIIFILCASTMVWGDNNTPLKVYTLDARCLETAKKMVEANDPGLKPAYDKLLKDAEDSLKIEPPTVVQKALTPPSGDKHDYMSIAPYWWPDPSKKDGLPYIQKDGQTNPDSKNDATDAVRKSLFINATDTLSLAYYFSGDKKYAEKAATLIRTWFLDPKTRMNPNLNYGQAVPGVVNGRGIGIIDFALIYKTIDDFGLLENANVLSANEKTRLVKWFKDYSHWLQTSQNGWEERMWHNNHGTWYDAQVIGIALYTGDLKTANLTLQEAAHRRLASQIALDGKQYAELERTRPFHYCFYNLQAMTLLARYGETVNFDLWNFVQDGRTLRKAIDYLAGYLDKPDDWPYKDMDNMKADLKDAIPVLLMAERAYGDGKYASLLKLMPENTRNIRDYLLWPVLESK